MVAQIIVSREDSTSFFSVGSVQDDASLVSALGGALASFAVEMGLSESGTTDANFSRFQNGALISKWLEVGTHRPSIIVAIRNFELEEYHQMFLIDYGTQLATKIISTFDRMYSSEGEIPKLSSIIPYIPAVAYEMYKDSPNTLKEFARKVERSTTKLMNEIWENQDDQGSYPFAFRNESYSPKKIPDLIKSFSHRFYWIGVQRDALFPLQFAQSPDMTRVDSFVQDFLEKSARTSKVELVNELKKVFKQLRNMSGSRFKRGKEDIEAVEFINANVIFERLSVLKLDKLEKEREKILSNLLETLQQKLYQKYPLRFLSASVGKEPITLEFFKSTFEEITSPMLNETFSDSSEIKKRIAIILRDVIADFTPEEVLKKTKEITRKVKYQYIRLVQKRDPFLILADANLKKLTKVAHSFSKEALENYRTAHDEAMALYYVVRQINKKLEKQKTATLTMKTNVSFLQEVVRKYQFRPVPKIVYGLAKEVLGEVASKVSSKNPVITLVNRNFKAFEKTVTFTIPNDIKKRVTKRLAIVGSSHQSFENIEALTVFTQVFSAALESTVTQLIGMLFGLGEYPMPPPLLAQSVQQLIETAQNQYRFGKILSVIQNTSAGKTILRKETLNFFAKNLPNEALLPTPRSLARIAYEKGWFIESKTKPAGKELTKFLSKAHQVRDLKKDTSKITDAKFDKIKVFIPQLNLYDKIANLLKSPVVVTQLWIHFCDAAILRTYKALNDYLGTLETKMKATGSTSSKKRYSTKIRRTKELVRAYSQLLRGRGIFRRLFGGTKNLCNLVAKTDREIFPGLYYYPKDFTVNPEIGLVFGNKLFMTRSQTVGNYKELAAIYASTWIRRSEYIRKLNESIIWRLLEEDSRKSSPLERKIVDNLQQEASKSGRVDQETVVRTTIEREVSLLFNQAVRAVIAVSFDALKQDLLVRKKKRGNKYHLSIMALDIPKEFLKEYEKLHATKISKVSDSKTELRLDISELLPQFSSRKKTSHSLRAYLGSAFIDILRSLHFKSLNALGELVEKYIGEQAADQFYEKRRLLEQVILESFDQS